MPVQQIIIGGKPVLVEVDELDPLAGSVAGADGWENTSTVGDLKAKVADVKGLVSAFAEELMAGLEKAAPDEWQLELSVGFKGEAGIPCLTKAEASAGLKVTVKWKKK